MKRSHSRGRLLRGTLRQQNNSDYSNFRGLRPRLQRARPLGLSRRPVSTTVSGSRLSRYLHRRGGGPAPCLAVQGDDASQGGTKDNGVAEPLRKTAKSRSLFDPTLPRGPSPNSLTKGEIRM